MSYAIHTPFRGNVVRLSIERNDCRSFNLIDELLAKCDTSEGTIGGNGTAATGESAPAKSSSAFDSPPQLRNRVLNLSLANIELGEPLGTGTVGEVFRGRWIKTGEEVAVKLLQPGLSENQLVRARFRLEMSILQRLNHPHIIRYFGGGDVDGRLYYAMEVVEGGNIRDLLDRYGKLNWQEVASVGRQVCSALQYAHNQGIIHRDLKPSNLFLTKEGCVKLGDFGIARDTNAEDITDQGITVGTHAYMSPEQITGQATLTGKADLYSLGCVLFELLTGEKPFAAGNNFALLFEQHLHKPAPKVTEYISDCPSKLASIIDQLLEKDPDRRPFNARTVQAVMLRLLEKRPAASSAEAASQPPDVGAGTVTDPGLQSLARKLLPPPERHVSWQALVIVSLLTIVAVCAVVLATRS
ncbi:Serine/threonine-protein kinase PknB [Aureliella helgolandensis]|uniref:non-specific serine/threonine protein kinase n=1 Tax=Aureliella helgolandensis TaxID=2527968 RepID=A0A518G2Z5_9BACT|nr:Serine/threonine-protein kinase PknB [Aureliella helgolandensis]